MVSVRVPIWFTLTDRVGETNLDAVGQSLGIGHEQSSPTSCIFLPSRFGDRLPSGPCRLPHAVPRSTRSGSASEIGVVVDHAAASSDLPSPSSSYFPF